MANAGRGGVGQPVSPAWRRRKKQRGLGAHVSKFSRRKLCQVFLPHQNSSTWIQLRCASFPFRPGGPGLSALPGSRTPFRAFLFFLSSFFVRLKNPSSRSTSSPPRLSRPTPGAAAPLTMASGSSGPRIGSAGSTEPQQQPRAILLPTIKSEARQAGLSSVWSTRPVVQSWWRSVSVSPQSSRHGHWEALRLDRWSRSCPVLSACSSHHPLSHWSLVEPPAEGGQLVYFAPADSPVKCALHKCVSLFSLGVWDQPLLQRPATKATANSRPPPNVVPGNKPSGSPAVPRAHNGLEQPSLRPSARQSMSVLGPWRCPVLWQVFPGCLSRLCRCSQPSLGDGGMIGRPGNKPSHPTRDVRPERNKSARAPRVLHSLATRGVGSRVIPEF